MKLILSIFAISVLIAGGLITAGATGVIDLSTLNKSPSLQPIVLPQVSTNMPTIPPTALGAKSYSREVLDLSTIGKKTQTSIPATLIKGANPITITPWYAVRNANATVQAGSVFTLPQAISANATVYTPPIAIFGGA